MYKVMRFIVILMLLCKVINNRGDLQESVGIDKRKSDETYVSSLV
jgi:hypothetical protein